MTRAGGFIEAVTRRLLALSLTAAKHPVRALVAMQIVVLAAALGLPRLQLRLDGHALVPSRDPLVELDAEVREAFQLQDKVVLYLDTGRPSGIFDPELLAYVRDLSAALAELPEIGPGQIMSLATETRPRVYPGTLKFRPLLDPIPDTPRRMEWLRQDLDAIGILDGVLVGTDRSGTAILVGVPASLAAPDGEIDRPAFYRRILELISRIPGPRATRTAAGAGGDGEPELRLSVVGSPVAEALLGAHVLQDLRLMVPLAFLVIAGVVWISCRRALAVLLVVGQAGACLLFTFGLMGWLGSPVFLTTVVLPVVLTTIGIADELHVLAHYQRELAARGKSHGAVVRTMDHMVRPVTITSLTTGLGFASFLAAPIAPVASFGAFAALGIGFCWLWTLVATPAALAVAGSRWLENPSLSAGRPPSSQRNRIQMAFRWLVARPDRTLVACCLLTLVLGAGMLGIEVQDSWLDGFPARSPLRIDTEAVDSALHGTHTLLIHVGFPEDPGRWPKTRRREGPLLQPEVLQAIGRFESALRDIKGVGGVLGPASHLSTVHDLFLAGRGGSRKIPETPERVDTVLDRFEMARGVDRRREVFHDDMHRAVVVLLVKGANFQDTAAIMERSRELAASHLSPLGAHIDFAGDLAVSQAMIPAIVKTQLRSVVLALIGAALVVWLLAGDRRVAWMAVGPTGVAILWLLGAMGHWRIPMGVATSTFCAITLGIGIDYAVHLLERFRRNGVLIEDADLSGSHRKPEDVFRAVSEAAPAIIADVAAVALGFGVLSLSQVPANARLGAFIAAALLSSAFLTLVGLSASVLWRQGRAGTDVRVHDDPRARALRGATSEIRPAGGTATVTGGSMRPLLRPGARVYTRPLPGTPRLGAILVYAAADRLVIHRLVRIERHGERLRWVTRGDLSPHCDPPIEPDRVLGQVVRIDTGRFSFAVDNHFWRALGRLSAAWTPALIAGFRAARRSAGRVARAAGWRGRPAGGPGRGTSNH